MRGSWISEYVLGFKYIRVLNILGLSICQGSHFPGLDKVYLFSYIWQGSEYAMGCNYEKVLNIPNIIFQEKCFSCYILLTDQNSLSGSLYFFR